MDNSQGQKIIAALYLVTSHLSDTDPIKSTLRQAAVDLVDDAVRSVDQSATLIETILGAAVLAQLVSEKNASIITLEVRRFVSGDREVHSPSVEAFFATPTLPQKSVLDTAQPSVSYTSIGQYKSAFHQTPTPKKYEKKKVDSVTQTEKKDKRQTAILSYITERTSATIKDIAALFPDTSEKTIQRELGALVASGRITKRGEKRWSVYMAVGK